MHKTLHRWILGAAGLVLATGALAHTGHGTEGIAAGLAHPLGLDHLLAMVAVGVWSATALPVRQRWLGPGCFLALLTLGAGVGVAGLSLPGVEYGIAASVLVFGLMLGLRERLTPLAGLALIALSASLHGLAHGAEIPAGASFLAYAAGFVFTTALLHVGGLGLGFWMDRGKTLVWRAVGALLGLTGVVMIARL